LRFVFYMLSPYLAHKSLPSFGWKRSPLGIIELAVPQLYPLISTRDG
jgi:hypothetical protein